MSTMRSARDLADIRTAYQGDEPEDMEKRMKAALAQISVLTYEDARRCGIGPQWIGDIKTRLKNQGFDVRYIDSFGQIIRISRTSQLKLQRQGFG